MAEKIAKNKPIYNQLIGTSVRGSSSNSSRSRRQHSCRADTNLLELPGGFINENEAESDAAWRELLKKLGIHVTKLS